MVTCKTFNVMLSIVAAIAYNINLDLPKIFML